MKPSTLTNSQPVIAIIAMATTIIGLFATQNLITNSTSKALAGLATVLIPPAYALGVAIYRALEHGTAARVRHAAAVEALARAQTPTG